MVRLRVCVFFFKCIDLKVEEFHWYIEGLLYMAPRGFISGFLIPSKKNTVINLPETNIGPKN